MSIAVECDICGALCRAERGLVSLEVNVEDVGSWSEVELCPACGDKVLELIKPALNDFESKTAEAAAEAALRG